MSVRFRRQRGSRPIHIADNKYPRYSGGESSGARLTPSAHPPSAALTQGADVLAASFTASYSGVVAFIAVVSEGSFAKAGDRLGVGRSAISRSVQRLEQQLGARLFFRTTRKTSLTREGELFYENCRPGVERIVQAVDGLRELRAGPPRGRLRVSSGISFGRTVVAPLLAGFQREYPEVAVDLLLDDSTVDLTSEHIDIAFRDGPPKSKAKSSSSNCFRCSSSCAARPSTPKSTGSPAACRS